MVRGGILDKDLKIHVVQNNEREKKTLKEYTFFPHNKLQTIPILRQPTKPIFARPPNINKNSPIVREIAQYCKEWSRDGFFFFEKPEIVHRA